VLIFTLKVCYTCYIASYIAGSVATFELNFFSLLHLLHATLATLRLTPGLLLVEALFEIKKGLLHLLHFDSPEMV